MRLISFLVIFGYLFCLSFAHEPWGINCYGSALCHQEGKWWDPIPVYLGIALEAVKPTGTLKYGNRTMYHRNEHIMCRGHDVYFGTTCVFLQGENVPEWGVPMQIIIERLAMLKEFNCRFCGSVPLSLDDDPMKYGYLTVNYVRKPKCGARWRRLCLAVTKLGYVRGAIEGPSDKPGTTEYIEDLETKLSSGAPAQPIEQVWAKNN